MNIFSLNLKFPYTGDELPRSTSSLDDEEKQYYETQKEFRRAIGLPTTKQLVYYPNPYSSNTTPVQVISFNATPFENAGTVFEWYDAELELLGIKEPVRIHCDYFCEMQKPNFLDYATSQDSEEK